ncbi:SAP30-binding protein [Podochytrium sp. JEL0797]|nr:SAP30-binding protein [Podochytrium sp. JEL0797]
MRTPSNPTFHRSNKKAKIEKWTHLRHTSGRRFNAQLEQTRAFGNPAIMSKLISFLGIEEHGTNLEKAVLDPNGFPVGMYYDEIAKAQKVVAERPPFSYNTHPLTGATAIVGGIAFAPPSAALKAQEEAVAKGTSNEKGKKRSRWDQ